MKPLAPNPWRNAALPATLALWLLAGLPFLVQAQTSTIPYPDVASALAALSARDGAGTIVTRPDDWTLINEPAAAAQWSFTPKGHAAHPAVVRRIVKRIGADVSVEMASLCEAPAEACAKLLQEFEAMNPRVIQAIKARGRQGSAQSMQAPTAPPPDAPARQP